MSTLAGTDTVEEVKTNILINIPKMYNVIFHNDDKTTFEFVVLVLNQIFHKSIDEALQITMTIHEKGRAVVAVYTKEIAEEKVYEVTRVASSYGYPLTVTCEPES